MTDDEQDGPDRYVTDDVLDAWRAGVHAWLAADPAAQGPSGAAADALASWVDALRLGGAERRWRGSGADAILDDAVLVGLVVVPHVVDRVGADGLGGFAVAVLRLALALPASTSPPAPSPPAVAAAGPGDGASAAHRALGAGLAALVGSRADARASVERWVGAASAEQAAVADGLLRDGARDVRAPGEPSAAELVVAAWRTAQAARTRVRRLLVGILTVVEEHFLLELEVDGEPISYVQGIVEEDRVLTVEVADGAFVGRPDDAERRAALLADGWNRPEAGLPNPWRRVDLDVLGAEEVAHLLVRAMDLCHAPFDGLPADAVVRVEPLAVAQAVVPDDATIVGVSGAGEGLDGPVRWPDAPVDLVPDGVLSGIAAAVVRGVSDAVGSRAGTALTDVVALAVRASASAVRRAASGGYGLPDAALAALEAVAAHVLPALSLGPASSTSRSALVRDDATGT